MNERAYPRDVWPPLAMRLRSVRGVDLAHLGQHARFGPPVLSERGKLSRMLDENPVGPPEAPEVQRPPSWARQRCMTRMHIQVASRVKDGFHSGRFCDLDERAPEVTCAFAHKPIRPLRSQEVTPRRQHRSATDADIIHPLDDVPFSG